MSWKVPRLWPDSTIYVIGAGPSLIGMDSCLPPRNGRYGLDAYLHDKYVVGVNDAFEIGDYVDVLFFGDTRWYWARKERIKQFKGLKLTCNKGTKWGKGHESVEQEPDIKVLNIYKSFGLTKKRDGVGWNRSSGGAALNIAVHLGAKRIIMLGYDMDDSDRGYDGLLRKHVPGMINEYKPDVYKFQSGAMPRLKKEFDLAHIEVLNANPHSAIKEFKKVKLGDVA